MSDEGISFDLRLKDEMSPAAQSGAKSLAGVKGEIVGVEREIRKLREEQIKLKEHGLSGIASQAGLEVQKLRLQLGDLRQEQKLLNAEMGSGILAQMGRSLIPKVAMGMLAADALRDLGKLAVGGVEFAVQAAGFKHHMESAYGVIRGGVEAGKDTFREIDVLAKSLHMPTEKAHEIAKSLMLQGLTNQENLKSTIAAISSLQEVGMEEGADKLKSVIERSLAAGHLQVEARTLKGTGVQLDQLYSELGMRLNKSRTEIDTEMKKGAIGLDDGLAALTAVIERSAIGDLAREKFSLGDVATDLKNTLRGLFQEADTSPMVQALKDLAGAFKPGTESAAELKTVLDATFKVLGGIIDAMKWIGSSVDLGKPAREIQIFERALGKIGLGPSYEHKVTAEEAAAVSAFEQKKRERSAGDVGITGRIGGIDLGKATEEIDRGTGVGTRDVGVSIGKGLADGLRSTIPDIHAAGREAGEAAHEGAKEGADAHSPSRKMAALGRDMDEGLALGVEENADRALGALGRVVKPEAIDVGSRAAGGSRTVDLSGMHIEVTGVQHAEEILTLLPSAIVDAFEQAANEVGA